MRIFFFFTGSNHPLVLAHIWNSSHPHETIKNWFQSCSQTHTQNSSHPQETRKNCKKDSNHVHCSITHTLNSHHTLSRRRSKTKDPTMLAFSHSELSSSSRDVKNSTKTFSIMLICSHSELSSSSRDEIKQLKTFQSCSYAQTLNSPHLNEMR